MSRPLHGLRSSESTGYALPPERKVSEQSNDLACRLVCPARIEIQDSIPADLRHARSVRRDVVVRGLFCGPRRSWSSASPILSATRRGGAIAGTEAAGSLRLG